MWHQTKKHEKGKALKNEEEEEEEEEESAEGAQDRKNTFGLKRLKKVY